MRVGLNLLPLVLGRAGGLRQHVAGLIEQLLAVDESTEYVCYVRRHRDRAFLQQHRRLLVIDIPAGGAELERRVRAGDIDVMFACCMDRGTVEPICPTVFLLPDLQHVDYPENFTADELRTRRLKWEAGARSSQRIAVSSAFVANRVHEYLSIPLDRIVLAPPPVVQHRFGRNAQTALTHFSKLRGSLPARFLFFPANTWAHKNHVRLLEALARANTGADPVHLVLTGHEASAHGAVLAAIRRLGLSDRVRWLGYVEDDLIPLLYRDAVALVFPSVYEGYGIPLLEAINAGCPIICSDAGSCSELVEDAALTFDPLNVEDICGAVERICNDELLRDALRSAGERRRSTIDPRAGARRLIEAFHTAVREYEDPTRWHWVERTVSAGESLPLVSIVTPSFQQGVFIEKTLESIRLQDYPRIEHIVIDGGSTDETLSVLRSHSDSIRWLSEPDRGQAHAVNKGLSMARGEIIGWLNSDDTYLPGAVSKAVAALSKSSGCLLVYGEAYYSDAHGDIQHRYRTETYSVRNLLRHDIICQPAVFFHRRLLELAGNLDERYHMAMDYEYWLRCSKITPFLYIPEYLATSRLYADNKTMRFRWRSVTESMRACRKHYGRTSLLWCRVFAVTITDGLPMPLRRFRTFRLAIQLVLFTFAWLRNELWGTIRDVLRTLKREALY